MEERLKKLKKMSRQYRFDIDGSFCKIWNGGMGRLTFVVPLESEKKVLVNSVIARNKDYERVAEVFPEFEIVKVAYGYPIFYNHSMLWAYRNGYAV